MKKVKKLTQKGFTLIEVLLVLFIISLLLLLFIPNISSHQKNATEKNQDAFQQVLQTQVELFAIANDGLVPTSFELLDLNEEQKTEADAHFKIKNGKVEKSSE